MNELKKEVPKEEKIEIVKGWLEKVCEAVEASKAKAYEQLQKVDFIKDNHELLILFAVYCFIIELLYFYDGESVAAHSAVIFLPLLFFVGIKIALNSLKK